MKKNKTSKRVSRVDRQAYLENTYLSKIGEKAFGAIMSSDPTFNKQYAQWIFKVYLELEEEKDKKIFFEDLFKTSEDLKIFYKYNSRLPLEKRDINNLSDLKDLYEVIKNIQENPDNFISKSEIIKGHKKDIDILLDNDDWIVLIPLTKEAAIIYGANTRWCTASSQYSHYETYVKDGPLYILINKKISSNHPEFKKYHKYQFHFESNQFMDAEDHSIPFEEFLSDNRDILNVFVGINNGHNLRLKLLFNLPISEEEKYIELNGKELDLSKIQCDTLPEGLVVNGSLNLEGSVHIKTIKNINVKERLMLTNSSIEKIEGTVIVGKMLNVNECKNLTSLPDGLKVGTSLEAQNTNLSKIPSGEVGGMAFFSYNPKITYIPKDLSVGFNLYVNHTGIVKVSDEEAKQYPKITKIVSGIVREKNKN